MRTIVMVAALLVTMGGGSAGEPKWTSRWMTVLLTHYCPGPCSECQTTGITKTGKRATGTRGCATDPSVIPTGSRLDVPGFKPWMPADDVGGAIKGARVDVRAGSHAEAKQLGRRWARVRVWERSE